MGDSSPVPRESLLKMNLSRAAKKFRAQMPQEPAAPRRAGDKKKTPPPPTPPPVPAPQPAVEPVPEPVAELPAAPAVPAATPKKARPVKAKRSRFVREKA